MMLEGNGHRARRMLVSLAHPDDESFGMAGTIARYSNDGVDVRLICATNGDVGSADPEYMTGHATMAELRLEELRCAAETLGFSQLYAFGYRDSGMPGSADNAHPNSLHSADPAEVTSRVTAIIREFRPQVVVTFDPFGGYGHPDHLKMHVATTEAFSAAGDAERFPEQLVDGIEPYHPQKLYYMTFDRRLMKWAVRLMPLFGQNPRAMGRNKDIDFQQIADHAYPIHARINIGAVSEQAERARACHASQLNGFGRPGLLQWVQQLFVRQNVDTFMRAYPPVVNGHLRERDLFAGVEVEPAN
jgi:LmbE family N-acetylglucosaminyl deacetylase